MSRLFFAAVATASAVASAPAADLKSGPQTGSKIPGPFAPLNVTGDDAGQRRCLVCKNGENPVVMIFARSADDPQTKKLLKAIDDATDKNAAAEMGSFVVFCTDDDALEAKLKDWAKKDGIKKMVVTTDTPTGPHSYRLDREADVTVILYASRDVKANHAFKKGTLTDAAITAVVADVSKIVPGK